MTNDQIYILLGVPIFFNGVLFAFFKYYIDQKFKVIDIRFDGIDQRFIEVNRRFDEADKKMDSMKELWRAEMHIKK